MTLKDLKIMLERDERQQSKLQQLSHELDSNQQLLVRRLANRPFWCGSVIDPNQEIMFPTHYWIA